MPDLPAIVTHWIYGKELFKKLSEEGVSLSSECAYVWGSQGPDLLFFHRRLPWQFGKSYQHYGENMHCDKPSDVFNALVEFVNSKDGAERDAALSYAMGICAHYALDVIAHPYVNCIQSRLEELAPLGEKYHYHGEIESALDMMMLEKYEGKKISEIHLCDCLPLDAYTEKAISEAWCLLLERVYGVVPEMKCCNQIVSDELTAYRLLDDRKHNKRNLFRSLERLVGIKSGAVTAYMRPREYDREFDFANEKHAKWHNVHSAEPEKTESEENFFELFERALSYGVEVGRYFVAAVNGEPHDFAAYTDERTFSYGVPSSPELR